jgi:hypothetical protein
VGIRSVLGAQARRTQSQFEGSAPDGFETPLRTGAEVVRETHLFQVDDGRQAPKFVNEYDQPDPDAATFTPVPSLVFFHMALGGRAL